MGLDMYAFARATKPATPVDFESGDDATQIAYWRKHPNLHGWMERLYREKGGTDETFNCVPVVLTADDLDRLERDVNNNALPETEGFFFGHSTAEDRATDLQFLEDAHNAIESGLTVYYTSWW